MRIIKYVVSSLGKKSNVDMLDQSNQYHVFSILERSLLKAMSISELVTASNQDQAIVQVIENINRVLPFRLEHR